MCGMGETLGCVFGERVLIYAGLQYTWAGLRYRGLKRRVTKDESVNGLELHKPEVNMGWRGIIENSGYRIWWLGLRIMVAEFGAGD